MKPGDPAGAWRYEASENRKAPPTPAELTKIFDEQDEREALGTDAWAALRRLAEEQEAEPIQWGTLVCRPDPLDFDPDLLIGELSPERLDALEGGSEPSEQEIERWQTISMDNAESEAGGALFAVHGWRVVDGRQRARILVTLHVDQGSFDQVAGLYRSVEEAAHLLNEYGRFEWLW
jgi:hypothetical protein